MITKSISVLFLLSILSSTGCFSKEVVRKDFWNTGKQRIGVGVLFHSLQDTVHILDKHGVVINDISYNDATPQSDEYIIQMVKRRMEEFRKQFVAKLKENGFLAKEIPYYLEPYFVNKAVMDLAPIAKKEDVDIIIVLEIGNFGVLYSIDKTKTVKHTEALFEAYGFMQEMKNGKMEAGLLRKHLWYDSVPKGKNRVSMDGNWKQPPSYPLVTSSLNEAIDNAGEYLFNSFFSRKEK
jgi:hypothetical protein